jgi:hypothetical protein
MVMMNYLPEMIMLRIGSESAVDDEGHSQLEAPSLIYLHPESASQAHSFWLYVQHDAFAMESEIGKLVRRLPQVVSVSLARGIS